MRLTSRSIVMDHLDNHIGSQNCDIAYIYFDAQDQEQQKSENVFASLLKQLILHSKYESSMINNIYHRHLARKIIPDFNEFLDSIISVCKLLSEIFIVLDTLDEAEKDYRCKVLMDLSHIFERVKILTIDRPHIAVLEYFKFSSIIEIQARDDDLRRYLEIELMKKGLTGNLKEIIITKLLLKTNGL